MEQKTYYQQLDKIIQNAKQLAHKKLASGENADEFIPLFAVGSTTVYIAATQDGGARNTCPIPHANKVNCMLYMIEGSMTVTFLESRETMTATKGSLLKVPAGVLHVAECEEMAIYLSVVDITTLEASQ
jgi:quercetin dioxygenase-like cupin family protein